jgi:hypothetical protein
MPSVVCQHLLAILPDFEVKVATTLAVFTDCTVQVFCDPHYADSASLAEKSILAHASIGADGLASAVVVGA